MASKDVKNLLTVPKRNLPRYFSAQFASPFLNTEDEGRRDKDDGDSTDNDEDDYDDKHQYNRTATLSVIHFCFKTAVTESFSVCRLACTFVLGLLSSAVYKTLYKKNTHKNLLKSRLT